VSEPVRRLALVTHQVQAVAEDILAGVLPLLREHAVELLLPPGERAKHPDLLRDAGDCCEVAREELADVDLCLVLGGDGTILRTLRLTRDLGVPVAGINLGQVGFFAAIARDRIAEDLPRVLAGEYVAHPLLGLSAQLNGTALRAVNDLVVGRGREPGIRRLSYSVNGVPLFDTRCDALVVATPAGSTAYNLAVGGPVLGTGVSGFVVSFVAPHSLVTRPLVAASGDTVLVVNQSGHTAVDVVADGEHVGSLEPYAGLEINSLPDVAELALLPEGSFYQQFRERFI
jgi:NAD+ kinase